MKTTRRIELVGAAAAAAAFLLIRGASAGGQDIPGPLSAAHAAKPGQASCSACHDAAGRVVPAKCLGCHAEIASRIAAGRGYHRDKADSCALCHAEHQGPGVPLAPLDPKSFDHGETGAELAGVHRITGECGLCHTPANTLPRSQGRSYLFKVRGCRSCHQPPHPGRQEDCLACHGQETWAVGRLSTRN